MSQEEIKAWSFTIEGIDFLDVRDYVKETLDSVYDGVEDERIVASTVFYPLRRYTPPGLNYKFLQVWVTPRHAKKVIVKVRIRGKNEDADYLMQANRALDKIVRSLKAEQE